MATTFKKILLTGINGQIGHALYPKLQSLGEVIALNRNQLNLSNPDQIREVVQSIQPDLIINPAAYTAVDKAESEPELAYAINGIAPGILAEEAAKLNALLVHYSTDYVFDGTKPTPYIETDETNPLSVYGASKLAGEKAIQSLYIPHLIFRTSWVYGNHGKNFLCKILNLATKQTGLSIVGDQFGAPTSTDSIAEATINTLQYWDIRKSGTYHMVNSGKTSWYGFTRRIIAQYDELATSKGWPKLKVKEENILNIPTADYPTYAQRPNNSCMNTEKLLETFGISLPIWHEALSQVMIKQNFPLR